VGFVANIKGRSRTPSSRGLQILANLDHRGAVGADPLVGDGAGCLIQIPDALFRAWAEKRASDLPPPGDYAVAMCFLPQDAKRARRRRPSSSIHRGRGQILLGWRDVPTVDPTGLGQAVLARCR
jgi:glutamate synthase (NADPH/NADH) large chain